MSSEWPDFFNMKPALADAVDTICINLPEQVQLEIPSKVLVFVIQFSGKVDSPEWAMLMEFVTTTIRNLQLGPNGTEVVVATVRRMINVYDFRQFTSHATIERVLLGSATITPTTVINMKELFKKIYSWKYPKSVQMILQICTDNYSEITTIDDEIKKWLSLGHLVHITAIGDKAPIEDIVRVVQDPENIQIIESYDLLATTTITLLQKIISGDVQVTVKNVSDISSFTCQVKTELDVIFVIDISASICVTGWNKVSRFLLDVVNFFKLGDTEVKVGAVFYSHEPQRVFDLRAFGEFKNIEKRLNEPHLSSTTRTDKAMKAIMEWNMFEPTSGGRHNVQDVIVLLTDGHSTNRKKAQLAADELMKKNVKVITLGVGRDVALKELRGLSHSRNHVIPTETFDKAQFAKLYLAKTICDAVSI
ncbi:collagen alpha-6(VI) chain-like [Physella acuta]|uniref:collagen alpha-6(VI) chain-like n=1 Tax=Physella acuta TaxID=109671 RepID=UPI0027DE52FA|nr:collagen alpha-6(VI) chain-like [Physella acuta]